MFKSVLFLFLLFSHPVHVSLMSIDYSQRKNEAEIYLMVYFDDFQRDYQLACGEPFGDENEINKTLVNDRILRYLRKRIYIAAPDTAELEINKITLSDNELKLFMKGYNIKRGRQLEVGNEILVNIYSDQSNLIIFRSNDYEEGIKLTPALRKHLFRIN